MSELRELVAGRGLVESPRWYQGKLWFSDWTSGEILAVEPDGRYEVAVRHASLPLCFDQLPDGRIVLVSNQERALLTVEGDGSLARYADLAQLSSFGCNDIVIDGRGNAYVNSANFEFQAGPPDTAVAPGFVALVRPGASTTIVARDIAFPNGMAITADNATLVVADSYRHCLIGFDIGADGSLSNRRIWADLGDDARTLYVVAAEWHGMESMSGAKPFHGRLLATEVDVPGAGWPART